MRYANFLLAMTALVLLASCRGAEQAQADRWLASPLVFQPGAAGTFDERAVKDPSIVRANGRWHLFYTSRGQQQYALGYASAEKLADLNAAERVKLTQLGGQQDPYAAAPQVFFYAPQQRWYLVYQTRDSNYQPMYSTTANIDDPQSWTPGAPLIQKDDPGKWIDFWVIADDEHAYLFFTRQQTDLYVAKTSLEQFPDGFSTPELAYSPMHEAVAIYRAKGKDEYHMYFETRVKEGEDIRQFGLATARSLAGPWTLTANDYITGAMLEWPEGVEPWTVEVSHGEMLRSGKDQRLEYDADRAEFLIQGLKAGEHHTDYKELAWKLGVIRQNALTDR